MKILSRNELETLLDDREGPCLSIYLPTVRAGAETQQNPIRFKNLLRRAEEELAREGLDRDEASDFLAPLWDLQEDHDFWQHQSDGLAVFLSSDDLRYYRLPLSFEELVAVNDRFYVKPLFSLLSGDGRFFILALSINEVRLFEASRYSVREVDFGDAPRSLADALGYDLEERHIQYHSGNTGAGAGRPPVYHGHGGGEEDRKPEIRKFFSLVDEAVLERIRDRDAPLVLAGVDYLLPIYRDASGYQHLIEEGVTGNPEDLRPEELHAKAWEIVKPEVLARREAATERFQELVGAGRASSELSEIVPAAFDGRIDTLFVARGEHRWGGFDPVTREVHVNGSDRSGEDLLDFAAVRTFLTGGTVYEVEGGKLPESDEPAAAIFRY